MAEDIRAARAEHMGMEATKTAGFRRLVLVPERSARAAKSGAIRRYRLARYAERPVAAAESPRLRIAPIG